jgi:rhodanese-related sulfurtransferase
MKKTDLFKVVLLLFAIVMVGLTGCKDEPIPVETDYYAVMTEYMEVNNLDLTDITTDWVIAAADVNTNGVATYHIIDLRAAADFNAGHIQGAVNSTLANVLTAAQSSGGKPILLVCYTGQTAAYAHVALRLSGYSTCKILKWGMSSWNAAFDSWTANIGNIGTGHGNWSTTNSIAAPVTFSLPEFTADDTTGAAILAERVEYMLSLGMRGLTATEVLASPSSFFINNYWIDADVTTYGHIIGAYRNKENLSLEADGFKNLDSGSTIVTYCWTGQTSAAVSAYLTVLGYDAKTIKFGCNAMIHDALQANKWTSSGDYPYVTE